MSVVGLRKQLRPLVPRMQVSSWVGVIIAVAISIAWLASLLWLLTWNLLAFSPIVLFAGVLVRTFFHTGLFVIAHDAIHGNILPYRPFENHLIGRLALGLYGFLPYQTCRKLHWQHHAYPAQTRDPDFYSKSDGPLFWYCARWYCNFMSNYLTYRNLAWIVLGIGMATGVLVFVAKVAIQNLVLFWIIPWFLSSVQLFVFGTFLPHHVNDHMENIHQPRSYHFPVIYSLLACYHFSYHWEHHTYPDIPWYQLPQVELAMVSAEVSSL